MDGTHQGGGIANVIAGIEHFPSHVIEALQNKDSLISRLLNSGPALALVAYEKTHGAEQLAAIEKAGIDAYDDERAKGVDRATAIVAGVRAAFECGIAEVKSLPTEAMVLLLSARAV